MAPLSFLFFILFLFLKDNNDNNYINSNNDVK